MNRLSLSCFELDLVQMNIIQLVGLYTQQNMQLSGLICIRVKDESTIDSELVDITLNQYAFEVMKRTGISGFFKDLLKFWW